MIELFIGFILLGFNTFFTYAVFNDFYEPLFVIISLIIWLIIICCYILGFKNMFFSFEMKKYGEEAYGRLTKKLFHNSKERILKANIRIYVEEIGNLKDFTQTLIIPYGEEYNIGDYFKGIYYKGKLRIDSKINENEVHSNLKYVLKNMKIDELDKE